MGDEKVYIGPTGRRYVLADPHDHRLDALRKVMGDDIRVNPRRLTDEELAAPSVVVEIDRKQFALLSRELQKEVMDLLFGYVNRGNEEKDIYVVAGYIAKELQQIAIRETK